jgi:hypothetical protein
LGTLENIIADDRLLVDLGTDDFLAVMEASSGELESTFLRGDSSGGDGHYHGAMIVQEAFAIFGVIRGAPARDLC